MGCHTWFYKRLNPQPTYEEVKKNVIALIRGSIEFNNEVIDGTVDPIFLEDYPELTPEFAKNQNLVFERQIRMIERGLCKAAVYGRYMQFEYGIQSINGAIYEDAGYHDTFRVYDYPDDNLFSLEETLKFIEKYQNSDKVITVQKDTIERLKQFWDEHPDGCINFG